MEEKFTYYTHQGTNHEDEIVGCAISELARQTVFFKRISSSEPIPQKGIVADIYREYDPEKRRFDHHQGKIKREDGYLYASAGLMWKHYGCDVVKNILDIECEATIDAVYKMVDKNFIKGVDACDADGDYKVEGTCSAGGINIMTSAKMVKFLSQEGSDEQDMMFYQIKQLYKELLIGLVKNSYGFLQDKERFYDVVDIENQVAVCEQSIRWKKICYEHNKNNDDKIYFIIMPSKRPESKWTLFAMPVNPGSRKLIYPIERYEGFDEFIHEGKWIAGSNDLDALKKLAQHSLQQNKRKYIEVERAKRLENAMSYFTSLNNSDVLNQIDKVDLVYEKGVIHERSEEFFEAVKKFHESRALIYEILEIDW